MLADSISAPAAILNLIFASVFTSVPSAQSAIKEPQLNSIFLSVLSSESPLDVSDKSVPKVLLVIKLADN